MEDRVLSQQEIGHDRRIEPLDTAGPESAEFPTLLRALRDARGLSKAELAKRTGFDPSTMTRFEQGSRAPDRPTVIQLAQAMVLPLTDSDRLLAAAGFRSVIWDDPMLIDLADALSDPLLPEDARAEMRSVIRMAISYSRHRRAHV
ncbi:MAG: helix-turn-helix transcriptional regulator [Thermomicrobiales bacterium]